MRIMLREAFAERDIRQKQVLLFNDVEMSGAVFCASSIYNRAVC